MYGFFSREKASKKQNPSYKKENSSNKKTKSTLLDTRWITLFLP